MDDANKGKLVVGAKVRLRDGREGNVTEIKDNQVVVTTGDGNTTEVATDEAELVDEDSAA